MPYKNPEDRASYPAYDQTEKAKKARAERNKARRMLMKEGKVAKGDGKDVHHKKVVPASKNRTFKRNPDHSMK